MSAAPSQGSLAPSGLPARQARLAGSLRELHQAVLRAFIGAGSQVHRDDLREVAAGLELDVEEAFAELARADLVHLDPAGKIVVAYPFCGHDTGISVSLAGGPQRWAMCAIDALGIPQMTGMDAVITAVDPHRQERVRVEMRGVQWSWQPPETVVLVAGGLHGESTAERSCPLITFHVNERSGLAYLAEHPGATGRVIAQSRAIEIAGESFAQMLAG
jgi:hypothetical protein